MEYLLYKYNDEFHHSGIKGMKWGVRRYQNKDGSLTPAGRKRYNAEAEALKTREKLIKRRENTKAKQAKLAAKKAELDAREKALDDADAAASGNSGKKGLFGRKNRDTKSSPKAEQKKTASNMTDAELDAAILRARKEDEYNRLRPEAVSKPKFMDRIAKDVIEPAAINAGRNLLQNTLNKAADNLLKGKADPNSIEALKKTAERLELTNKINKLKNNPEGDTNWDNMLKKQDYERKKKKYDAEDAAEKAKTDAAEKAKKSAMDEYDRYQDAYRESLEPKPSTTYSNKGGERGYVNPNETRSLVVRNSSVSNVSVNNIPKETVSKGQSAVVDLLDSNGDVLVSNLWGDDD